jgi:IPT/TIG domain.
LTSTGGNVPFSTSFTPATGGAFLTISPASGTTPGPIQIALNQSVVSKLGPGTYAGTIAVSSPNIPNGTQLINVSLTIAPQGPPSVVTIANAASNTPGAVAPGEIISIYGTGIGPNAAAVFQLNAQGFVPTSLSNVQVTFDGTPAPLLYVSSSQINAIVPYQIAGRSTTTLIVQGPGGSSSPINLRVADTAPAIFSLGQGGSGQGAILNQNASVNASPTRLPRDRLFRSMLPARELSPARPRVR